MSPDAGVRKPAEEGIAYLKQQAGYAPALLDTSANGRLALDVRLAAAVQLGMFVSVVWSLPKKCILAEYG